MNAKYSKEEIQDLITAYQNDLRQCNMVAESVRRQWRLVIHALRLALREAK